MGSSTASPGLEPAATVSLAGHALPAHFGDPAAEYTAAHRGAVVVWRTHEGRVRAVDRDRLDLLHRMSTNDLSNMVAGEARLTVLTTPIARMVDVLWVLNRGETVLAVTGPGRATVVRRWLAGYVFYNDKVRFEDASIDLGQFAVYGPGAAAVAEALAPGAGALAENRFLDRGDWLIARGRPLAGDGYTVIGQSVLMSELWDSALAAGAAPAGETAYQWLRLEAGRPEGGADGSAQVGQEVTEDYIPLEANLWDAVSFTKGCYIGQEIIARMESRGKLARRLVGLRLEAPVTVEAEVQPADGGQTAGRVTSAAVLPDHGPVALAYLRNVLANPGTPILVEETAGKVVELPFRA